MKCIACKNFTFENIGGGTGENATPTKMATLGLGRCKYVKENYKYMPANFERECDKYEAAGKKLVAARIAWLAEQSNQGTLI